jgi:Fe-S-cluster-containing dehydrogenase component
MADVMAVFQDLDKCIRCNGCVIACKREWNLKAETIGSHNVAYDQRLAIKSQKRVDMGPFLRFTCWHCPDPPCAKACPLGAISKKPNGAVAVDNAICNPLVCKNRFGQYPCTIECQRGGYPKVGVPYQGTTALKMNKCTLCSGRAGADADVDMNIALPTRATSAEIAAVPGKAHEPACVSTCPAKAMMWDTRANILAFLNDPANGYILGPDSAAPGTTNWFGNGSMFWGSRKGLFAPPKADPFIEDHISPMTQSMLTGGIAKAALLPTLVVGGLMALSVRRARNEQAATGEEV